MSAHEQLERLRALMSNDIYTPCLLLLLLYTLRAMMVSRKFVMVVIRIMSAILKQRKTSALLFHNNIRRMRARLYVVLTYYQRAVCSVVSMVSCTRTT